MDTPTSDDELLALHRLCQSDPHRYLAIMTERITKNPQDSNAYFSRHYGWLKTGQPKIALDDINRVIQLDPSEVAYTCRAKLYRHLGDHRKALEDYERVEHESPELWREDWMSLLYQADSYARIGDLTDALRCWQQLPDDVWTPGPNGAPGGNKTQIHEELLRLAAEAREENR
jgi:tetratricopeptide (TPR) repeat protein